MAWYLAALFSDGTLAKRAWQTIYDGIGRINSTASATNMLYRGQHCVVCFAPDGDMPKPAVKQLVERCFVACGGQDIVLSESTIQDLLDRRARRQPQVLGRSGVVYESHTPQAVITGESSREENEVHLRKVVETLSSSGMPFFEIYKMYIPINYQIRLSVIVEHAQPQYLAGFTERVDHAAKYIFTESARAMHKAVYEESSDWIETGEKQIWIEQDAAQTFPSYSTTVKAVHVAQVQDALQDVVLVTVIDDLARHRFTFLYDPRKIEYEATVDYECLHGQCKNVQQTLPDGYLTFYREVCPACEAEMQIWAQWLHTTMRMLRKDFATSPDPEEFKHREIAYTQKKKMPRHHGKGAPKERTIQMSATYTIVAYDVSETSTMLHFDEEEQESQEKRENWLRLHGKEDIIYIKRSIASHPRRYPVRRDGTRTSGMITVNYPDGKYVPMLRPEARKTQPIRRVTARKYDE